MAKRVADRALRPAAAMTSLAIELRDTPGGRNLLEIGIDHDLVDCARIDRSTVVPELDVRDWRITRIASKSLR